MISSRKTASGKVFNFQLALEAKAAAAAEAAFFSAYRSPVGSLQ